MPNKKQHNQDNERTFTDQYGDFVKKLAPFGWETITIASANLLGIFMIFVANQYIELRYGLLVFMFVEFIFVGVMYWKRTEKIK